jgi:hypothetical protein
VANPFNDRMNWGITEDVKPQHCGVAQRFVVQRSTMLTNAGSIGCCDE